MLYLDDPELDAMLRAHWPQPRLGETMRFMTAVFLVLDAVENGDVEWPQDVEEFGELVRAAMRRRMD